MKLTFLQRLLFLFDPHRLDNDFVIINKTRFKILRCRRTESPEMVRRLKETPKQRRTVIAHDLTNGLVREAERCGAVSITEFKDSNLGESIHEAKLMYITPR